MFLSSNKHSNPFSHLQTLDNNRCGPFTTAYSWNVRKHMEQWLGSFVPPSLTLMTRCAAGWSPPDRLSDVGSKPYGSHVLSIWFESTASIHAFIVSRLNYCKSILYSLLSELLNKLQNIQNSAAWLVTHSRLQNPITPVLQNLHWLPHTYDYPSHTVQNSAPHLQSSP